MTAIIPPETGRDPLDPGPVPTTSEPTVGNTRGFCLGAYWIGNYPSVVTFHEDRLCLAGAPQSPQRIDMSNSGLYDVFSPSELLTGQVVDSNACAFTLSSAQVNAIRWLVADSAGLQIGTAGGEWLMSPTSSGAVITPTNVNARQSSQNGSSTTQPVRVGHETIYNQIGGKRIRQQLYDYYANGLIGTDLSFRAAHLTVSGFKQFAYQRTPQPILWALRNDGQLVSILYDRSEQDKPQDCGWALHDISGGLVKSIQVIPSVDGTRDELWMAVQRTINGATKVYTERMTKLWEEGDATAYTLGTETVYKFTPENTYYLDSAQRGTFGSPVTTVSGLDHLEGETVGVLADGATHPDCVVSGGAITLARSASDVNVGLKYESRGRTMTLEGGAAAGTAQTKKKKIHRVGFRLFDTLGLTVRAFGTGGEQDVVEPFRRTQDLMDAPPPLFSGDFDVDWEGTWETDGTVEFAQADPLPFNLSMLVVSLDVSDG